MKEKLINYDLLEEIRTISDNSTWQDRNEHNIVDHGYTHKYLLANRTVDKIIKEFYFKPFRKIYTTDEWRGLINADVHNKIDITNHCSYLIEGALHNKVNLYLKINALLELKDQHILNHKYEYFSELKPYFTSYAKDFKLGYNQFLNVVVKPFLLFDNNKEEASHIIFRYITNNQSNDPVVSLNSGFKMSFKNDDYDIDYDFLDGLHEGYLYRAWGLIFSQNELFSPLFQKYIANSNITKSLKNKLTIDQIALKYVYEGASITRNNCQSIIKQYELKSGEKLYQRFTHYSSRANRKGIPQNCTPKKLENKIKLIENVIKMLPNDCKNQALDEVNILKILARNKDY